MNISRLIILSGFAAIIFLNALYLKASGVPDQFSDSYSIVTDTIPMQDRTGDFITGQTYNPFDIMPSIVTQEVEYDAKTNQYILIEKIGNEYYRPPTYLTFDEYMEWNSKQQEKEYFNSLAGIQSKKPSLSGKIDPMDKIDVSKGLVDKMFGGTEVNIKPQGNVDLTLGIVDYRKTIGANVTPAQARQLYIPGDFRIQPRLNVDGSIGKKLNLGFNYDATSTFDFDKKIKLDYSGDAFNEDDIIKKIEAGNVTLPLKGNLIQGGQALFGFKTEVQFGHLRLTGILSQQRSKRNNIKIENGAAVQDIEIYPTEYDENRNFFISHYNRDTYEDALSNLPQIKTAFRLAQIEVWVSNDRLEYQNQSRKIVGLTDLGEAEAKNFHNPNYIPSIAIPSGLKGANNVALPDNRQNNIYEDIITTPEANESDKVNRALTQLGLVNNRDYESFQGRLLSPSEYTVNEQLGTISLNFRLQPDDALAVSYKYYFTENCDSIYSMGQLASEGTETSEALDPNEEPKAGKVIFAKLLKSVNQQPSFPSWGLMMKNVYNLRTSSLSRDGFTFDIYYEDDNNDGSLKKYIPLPETRFDPLLNIFKLDTLNRYGDPQSDGVIDYVPGVTVIERTGSIVFPVLEPFGSTLTRYFKSKNLSDTTLSAFYSFPELYDSTLTIASYNFSQKNKFVMKARVESATSGEIYLGPSIPQGSVRVRAGGVTLIENQDYEIDYSLGRLRVLNPAYLNQGTPITVSFEDNGAFNLNTKTMNGLRADYEFNKNFSVGATFLRLKERPFTQKVNIGDDPISNKIYGLDLNYNDEMPWLTTLVDKLPFYSTKAPSSLALTAEAAYLKPGHNKVINLNGEDGGVVSIDDFEGAISGFSLGSFNVNAWSLASTPPEFPESTLIDNLESGANRALMNWYQVDESARSSSGVFDPYTRTVDLQELFERQTDIGLNRLYTFDLSYYPEERGPYNFDKVGGYPPNTAGIEIDNDKKKIKLLNPKSRWGGIMRSFQNTDFQAANYEFIEFWVLNPFLDREDNADHTGEDGELIFNLGSVSEDIIKDELQFYENGLPDSSSIDKIDLRSTSYGRVPLKTPFTRGFNINSISQQDLGLDGMTDAEEREKFTSYLANIPGTFSDIYDDPSGDNFEYYSSDSLRDNEPNVLNRFKRFNNPQGNSPLNSQNNADQNTYIRGNSTPESEDLNNNRSLEQAEVFWEYKVNVKNLNGEIDTAATPYYRQTKVVTRAGSGGGTVTEKWYRFQIPLNTGKSIGGISGFRNIRFMRMYMTKFNTAKTFRLADFQLVRNLWRRSPVICSTDVGSEVVFSVDKVGIQENSTRLPFNYKIPMGIQQETLLGTFGNIQQDEKAMVLKFEKLADSCEVAVNKLARLNLTQYKKMQLFVHAEDAVEAFNDIKLTPKGEKPDLAVFIRVGKDLINNYYEYEMPIQISDPSSPTIESNIWLDTNFVNFELDKFLEVKKLKLGNQGTLIGPDNNITQMDDPDNAGAYFRIKGTPSLGLVKQVEVGIRSKTGDKQRFLNGQIWINELRCVGLQEKGGVAAQARMQVKMADFGEISASANYSSIGFGALDKRLQDRSQEEIIQYDIATTLQLGKILPPILKLNLPFYAQYSKSISNPRYDPYQLDLSTNEILEATSEPDLKADIADRAATVTTIKSYNFTNVKFDIGKGKMPWSPKNISATYAYTESNTKAPIIIEEKEVERKLGLDYRYSMKPLYIVPLKFIKVKSLKFLSDFNFNLIPNTFSFNTTLNRFNNTRRFRLPVEPVFQFEDQRFKWDRNYNVDWDIAKSLRFTFRAQTTSLVDELRQVGIADNPKDRKWVDENGNNLSDNDEPYTSADVNSYRKDNLKSLGRSKNYSHDAGLSYRLPFKSIPILNWITTTADYKAQYGWTGGALIEIDTFGTLIGNTIQNSQTRSINSNFSFDKLYSKSKYLKKIEDGNRKSNSRQRGSRSSRNSKDEKSKDVATKDDKKDDKKEKKKGERTVSLAERIIIRPFLSLRSVKFSYREDFATVVPGFMNESSLLGLESGFKSPGWGFAAGLQPDLNKDNPNNWLKTNQQWFNKSKNFNDQLSQSKRQNITAKIKLEPFRDFDVDLDFSKDYRRDHTEIFKFKTNDPAKPNEFNQVALYDVGSFEVTHYGLKTLFRNNEDLLQIFKQNKLLVSGKLNPSGDPHSVDSTYFKGYGALSSKVNIPAFYAAYTGQNINDINLDIRDEISALSYIPKPNWQVRYDGLSKIPAMKKIFKSFQLKHGYKSTMTVSRFNTNPNYNPTTAETLESINGNYYAELEIPAISINEQFNPIIGVSVKTQSDMSINFEWKKARKLDLSLQATTLTEDLSNEFVFGFGYVLKDFKGFTSKKKRQRKKKDNPDNPDDPDAKDKKDKGAFDFSKGGLVTNEKGRTLTMNLDFSFRDNVSLIYNLGDDAPGEANRGTKTFNIEPSLDYQLYKNLSLRWFATYSKSQPYNTQQNGFITFATGFTVRFNFN